jgi:hypothetical protein
MRIVEMVVERGPLLTPMQVSSNQFACMDKALSELTRQEHAVHEGRCVAAD